MTARITETTESETHVIRLEGQLGEPDARLVERLCADARARGVRSIVVDLDDLTFLDEGSADVLRALKRQAGVAFRGCCLFNARLIDGAK